MITHHTMGGCNLRPGDLFGTGTISAPGSDGFGSILETTQGGRESSASSVRRGGRFLEDGDEVVLRAYANRTGYVSIGFGECRATILPAR
jgi:fumarylacetoacetase